MDLSDLKLSYYNMELVRCASEYTSDQIYHGKKLEVVFRPALIGQAMCDNDLFKDMNIMNAVRSSESDAVKEAYAQLLTVMALST